MRMQLSLDMYDALHGRLGKTVGRIKLIRGFYVAFATSAISAPFSRKRDEANSIAP